MGTYSKPGLTAGEAALISDPAAALSKAIGKVSGAFNTQMANIQISKEALAKSTAELNQQANSIKTDQGNTLASKTQDILKKEIDRVYRLKYNSIGRDQSEAIKAESDLLNMVKKMPEVMAFYDQEASQYKENIINGRANSTISNLRTNKNSRGFYDDITSNNGNDITPVYENGQLIFKYGEGKDAFEQNSVNYYEGVKKGADSNIGYIDQDKYPAAYKATFDQYTKRYPSILKQIETLNKQGGITITESKDYKKQAELIKRDLLTDKQLINDIDSDEFQFLIGSSYLDPKGDQEPFVGSADQIKRAQEAKVNFIMDQFAKEQEITNKIDQNLPRQTKSNSSNPENVYTQSTREQIAEFGDEYVETSNAIKEAINDVFLMAPVLTQYSDKTTSYLTYDDIVKKVNNETGENLNFKTKEEADKFLSKLNKSSIYIEEKGKINIKKPISVLDSNFNELVDIAMKGRYEGIRPATLSVFKDRYKDVKRTDTKKQSFDPNDFKKKNNTEQVNLKTEETQEPIVSAAEVEPEVKATQPSSRNLKVENKKQEDIMRNSEVTYGGVTGDNQDTRPLTTYKDYDFQTYLNTKEQVSDNPKIGLYGKSKHPKRGLKVDLGKDIYNGLSDGQQAMMRMQHINIPWDPRVVMLMATGVIKGKTKRTEYLGDYEATTELYNKNKAKFKNIDDQKMFDQWVDIYSGTQPNEPGYQKQYKRRVEDMAKAYGYALTKEQLAKFKV